MLTPSPKSEESGYACQKSYLVDVLGCPKHKACLNVPMDTLQTTYEKNRQIRKLAGEAKDRSGFGPVDMFGLTGAYCG